MFWLAALLLLTVLPRPATAQTSGLAAHWTLDDGSGTGATDGVGGNTGTLVNGASFGAGRIAGGVDFDGVNDYVLLPNLDVSGSAITIAAWVRNSGFPNQVDQRFISKSTDTAEQSHYWMLSSTNNGQNRLRFRLKAGGSTTTLIASSGDLPLHTWYHVAATYDGTAMRLYLNGTQVGTVAKSGPIATSPSVPVNIGRNPDGSNHLSGAMDEVRLYNRALSVTEIQALSTMASGPPPTDTPPVNDTTPPVISALAATGVSDTGATITWMTNEPATSKVDYGTTAAGGSTASMSGLRTAHVLNLTGLQPSTPYRYVAVSVDGAGNQVVSGELGFSTQAAAIGTPGLVAHWPLEDGGGTVASDAVGLNPGMLINGASFGAGRVGGGIDFDGTNDYLLLPSVDVPGNAITIAAWVKNSGFPFQVDQRFVSKATDTAEQSHYWMLSLTNNGQNRLRFRLKAGGSTTTLIASSGDLPLQTWYHVAATYDGSAMRLYLNGTQVGAVPKSGTLATNAGVPVNIGRNPDGSNYLHGAIDDVRIYNRALTDTEIGALNGALAPAPANQPPTVSLSGPPSGSGYTVPATITIAADANDTDGIIAQVDFYAGSTLIGSDTNSPFSFVWNNVGAGSYSLTAVARDNTGATATSSARTVTVGGGGNGVANQSPSVSLTAPLSGTIYSAPATIALVATAGDADGAVAGVDFYAGTELIGSDTTSPYTVSWTDVSAGSYSLTAVARDNGGGMTVSSERTVTVIAPQALRTAVFNASTNHDTAVDRYVLEIFPEGADPSSSNPVATQDLGKPAVIDGLVRADVTQTIVALPPGTYIATVTAAGSGGTARSEPSPSFTR